MKHFFAALLILIACASISGCAKNNRPEQSVEFFAMDTLMTMTAYGDMAKNALSAAQDEINRLDDLLSVGNSSSEVYRLNKDGGGELSAQTASLIKKSLEIYEFTNGAFDITVYPFMKRWGFYTGDYEVLTQAQLSELLKLTGSDKLELTQDSLKFKKPGMGIDFGGIAKGYASDRAIEILKESGVESALISLGGNIKALGSKPDGSLWRIAILNPKDKKNPIGIVKIADKAVITSGGYERYFEVDGKTYHHILDPKTGIPAETSLESVTIVCDSALLGDGLSTAFFVAGKQKAIELWRSRFAQFDVVLVTQTKEIFITSGLEGVFSSNFDYEVIQ